MRVSLLNLNLVARDAIGTSIIAQARFFLNRGDTVYIWIEQPPEGVSPEIASICRVVTPAQLQRDRRGLFAATDLYIYHYGGRHGLMDSINAIDGGVVCFYYHNVTPPELWNVEEDKATLRRGIQGVKLAAQADFVFGDSKYNLRQLAEISGVPPERLFPLSLPVDISAFHPGPRPRRLCQKYGLGDEPVLLYIGRMAPNKRIDLLVDLLAAVRKHPRHPQPNARLLLVGDELSAPAYRLETERARARARSLGVTDALIFTGRVDPHEYYRLASVYVTTSQHEGFCLPLIEAMASGVPVVAAATTAIPETMGNAGVLVSTNAAGEANSAKMADAVVQILSDDALAADLVERGLAHAASFSLERYYAEFARVIELQCINLPQRVQPIPQLPVTQDRDDGDEQPLATAEAAPGPAAGKPSDDAVHWPELADSAEITMPEYTVRSRVPIVGGLIAWVRRNLTSHLKEPYVDPILWRQQWYNVRNLNTINQITDRLLAVEQQTARTDPASVKGRLGRLEAGLTAGWQQTYSKQEELHREIIRLENQLARVESLLAEDRA